MGSGSSRKKPDSANKNSNKRQIAKPGFIDAGELADSAQKETKTTTAQSAGIEEGMEEGKQAKL